MDLFIRHEMNLNFEQTARLAADGFGKPPGSFCPAKLRWLYDRAFSHGTTVLSAYAGEDKVGQVALVHQQVGIDGSSYKAVQLVDLFILKAFRSRSAIADLYGEVERFCMSNEIRFIFGVPNASGARVNVRYLKLAPFLKLDIRAGIGLPIRTRRVLVSTDLSQMSASGAQALFAPFLPLPGAGLEWTADGLHARFCDQSNRFGVHATKDLLLVSSPRVSRGRNYVLLCAILKRSGATIGPADVRALTFAACALHGRALFIYAGLNTSIPLPGWRVPERFRPSPMEVQMRDFQTPEQPVRFDRFEMLDFDFA